METELDEVYPNTDVKSQRYKILINMQYDNEIAKKRGVLCPVMRRAIIGKR